MLKKTKSFILKRKLLLIGIVILLGVLFFIFKPKTPPQIATSSVKRGTLKVTVSISGKITAKQYADLNFMAGGLLTYVGVKEGDTVSQYQTIATIDQRSIQKSIQNALIDYSKQRNTFEQTNANNGISVYDQNTTPYATVNDTVKRILQNNQYDLDKAVNSVELQTYARDQSVLSSPIAGIVTRADAKTAGINVSPTTVFEIVNPNSLAFTMEVDEADIAKIASGEAVTVNLDAYPDTYIPLQVSHIDFSTHTTSTGGNAYNVDANITNPSQVQYRIGMNGNADILTQEKKDILTIPITALVDDTYVYVKKGTKYIKTKVKLGLQSDTDTEVVSGLSQGDVVTLEPTKIPKQ